MDYYEDYWKNTDAWSPSAGGVRSREENIFKDLYSEKAVLLDYGCGNCERYGKMLLARGFDYRGFDISSAAVKVANENKIPAQCFVDGVTSLADSEADCAICFEVLEHMLNPENATDEVYRVLKKGGAFAGSVPNPGHIAFRLEFLLTGFLVPGGSPETSRKTPWNDAHIRFYSTSSLKKLLIHSGFEDVKIIGETFSLGSFPYIYKTKKLRKFCELLSLPFGWLGKMFPSIFSGTLYFTASKS